MRFSGNANVTQKKFNYCLIARDPTYKIERDLQCLSNLLVS
jgi:hypothetical protein